MTKRVLVTGGAGFLGSQLCERLLSDGHEVICLDSFGSGQRKNIEEIEDHPSFTINDRDVRIPGSLLSVDRMYHLASRASPADFTDFPVNIALANTQGTRRPLDHARTCDARMVLVDTSSEITYEPLPEDDPSQRRPDITRAKTELNWEPEIHSTEEL